MLMGVGVCVVSTTHSKAQPVGCQGDGAALTSSSLKTVATSLLWSPKAGRIAPKSWAIRSTPVWPISLVAS